MPVMHSHAPSSATRSWPTKAATLLFSGGLASLAILHAGSPACSPESPPAPAKPQPVTPPVVEATKIEPRTPSQKPPAPTPPPTNPTATNPTATNPTATNPTATNPPPPRYLGGSKSAAVFEPEFAPQTQTNTKPRGAR